MSKLDGTHRAAGALLATCCWALWAGCQAEQRVERRPVFQTPAIQTAPTDKIIRTIAFGSCANQEKPQPIWEAIAELQPDLFLLLGDNIYGDTQDMDEMRRKYAQLGAKPGFRKLCEVCPILATWDDHDYGENDAGADYPMRRASQQVFCDFFGEPASSPGGSARASTTAGSLVHSAAAYRSSCSTRAIFAAHWSPGRGAAWTPTATLPGT